jgi:putative DNA primase/helicase
MGMIYSIPILERHGDETMKTREEIDERNAKAKKKYAETLVVQTFDERDREYPKTDMGNAQQLAERYQDLLRWGEKCWWKYDGSKWVKSDETAVRALAQVMVQEWYAFDRPYAHECSDIRKLNAMVNLTKDALPLQETFNTQSHLFNCANGTIDLRTGELQEHNPLDFFTQISPVAYEPDFQLREFDSYLKTVTGGDPAIALYLQKLAGMTLLGRLPERGFYVVIGPKGSGKSTFAEALRAMSGDFGKVANFKETFGRKMANGGPSPAIARLEGARMIVCDEVPDREPIEDDLVKLFSAGGRVVARGLYTSHVDFEATATLLLMCNEAPAFNITDTALWDRIRFVRFPYTIPRNDRDLTLQPLLKDPDVGGKAVLAWAVKGLLLYQGEGIVEPECIQTWTKEQYDEQNPVAEWFHERVIIEANAWVTFKDVYESYL